MCTVELLEVSEQGMMVSLCEKRESTVSALVVLSQREDVCFVTGVSCLSVSVSCGMNLRGNTWIYTLSFFVRKRYQPRWLGRMLLGMYKI